MEQIATGDVTERTSGASEETWELVLDCSACVTGPTEACSDCLVSYVLDGAGQAIVYDADEERTLRSLARAGLIDDVRYRRETG